MRVLKENKTYEDYIIDLNKEDQLYNHGIDVHGLKLVSPHATNKLIRNKIVYAPNTVFGTNEYEGKLAKKQRVDNITFKDTGKFYESFKIILNDKFNLQIVANDINGLEDQWGKIIGWTDENYTKAILKAQEILSIYIKDQLKEFRKAA